MRSISVAAPVHRLQVRVADPEIADLDVVVKSQASASGTATSGPPMQARSVSAPRRRPSPIRTTEGMSHQP
jgi:hypothetical protein